jgi:hypothetical protein
MKQLLANQLTLGLYLGHVIVLHWSHVYAFDIGHLGPNIFQAVTLIAIG